MDRVVVTAGCFMKNEKRKKKEKTDYTRFTTVRTRARSGCIYLSRDFFLRLRVNKNR